LVTDRNKAYRSENKSVSHCCGHDGHIAMLLTTARVLVAERDKFTGFVKFIFQPAEEGKGGAKAMIEDGVLEEGKCGPRVDCVYGIHLWNYLNYGSVGVKSGPLMAASDFFQINLSGKGGHGAIPQGTCDAIVGAGQLITQVNSIVSRNVNPLESAVVTIGTVNGGSNYNVIADTVTMTGTIRSFYSSTRSIVLQRMEAICNGLDVSFGVKAKFDLRPGYPCTINRSEAHVSAVQRAASRVVDKANVVTPESTMGAEDFAYYQEKRDGVFFFVGSSPVLLNAPHIAGQADHLEASEKPTPFLAHHTSVFDIDERSLAVGASIFVHLVLDR